MTEELKQKAISFICKKFSIAEDKLEEAKDNCDFANIFEHYVDLYIAGATENGIQWHDLRKDPNDLPKDNVVLIQTESNCHFIALYYPEEKWWGTYEMLSHRIHGKIIAWCEIPQFKE